jgi:hypothetical protein
MLTREQAERRLSTRVLRQQNLTVKIEHVNANENGKAILMHSESHVRDTKGYAMTSRKR